MSRRPTQEERHRASREYLMQVRRMQTRLASLRERRAYYRDLATQITARYGTAPGGAGPAGSKVERAALKIAAIEEELLAREGECAAVAIEVERAISELGDAKYRDVLTYRYLNCWGWARIARGMNYSRDYVMELHASALKAFTPPGPPRI